MTKQSSNRLDLDHGVTRRKFLGTTALSSAALLSGGLTSLVSRSASAAHDFEFIEATIPELQAAMASGQLTQQGFGEGLSRSYRVAELIASFGHRDKSQCRFHCAASRSMSAAEDTFAARSTGFPFWSRTTSRPTTTWRRRRARLRWLTASVPADAVIIQRLRAAGAVILGKANLGEWANFRGTDIVYPLAVGWSARGGSTNNAYDLSYTSWGSSAGSANGAAANLCSVAVGTETDGSITGPSAVENVVGLKPTVRTRLARRDYSNCP